MAKHKESRDDPADDQNLSTPFLNPPDPSRVVRAFQFFMKDTFKTINSMADALDATGERIDKLDELTKRLEVLTNRAQGSVAMLSKRFDLFVRSAQDNDDEHDNRLKTLEDGAKQQRLVNSRINKAERDIADLKTPNPNANDAGQIFSVLTGGAIDLSSCPKCKAAWYIADPDEAEDEPCNILNMVCRFGHRTEIVLNYLPDVMPKPIPPIKPAGSEDVELPDPEEALVSEEFHPAPKPIKPEPDPFNRGM
jgi:hypothetical protein